MLPWHRRPRERAGTAGRPRHGTIERCFLEVRVASGEVAALPLREGREKRLIAGPALLAMHVTPYDAFAIWMHTWRHELARR